MSKVTVSGKTIEEAVHSALTQLQTTEEFVNIRVITEPSKGFLGFGSKKALVEVELKENVTVKITTEDTVTTVETEDSEVNALDKAETFLREVLLKMGLTSFEIHVQQEKEAIIFNVSGDNLGMVIGRRGQTLDSIQYLTSLVANRYSREYRRIIVNPENYRERRKETLEQLADRLAKKAIRSGEKVILEPMNPAERKIIHTHLQNYAGITTKSEGVEPNRRLVIFLKNLTSK